MSKRALITGITGQDGAYLAKFLLNKGYRVFGTYRRLSTSNFWRLQYLGVFDKVELIPADLLDSASLFEAVKISEPADLTRDATHWPNTLLILYLSHLYREKIGLHSSIHRKVRTEY